MTSNVLNEEISGSPERDQGFQGGYQEYYFKVLNMYSISINCYSNTNWFCNYSTTSKKLNKYTHIFLLGNNDVVMEVAGKH